MLEAWLPPLPGRDLPRDTSLPTGEHGAQRSLRALLFVAVLFYGLALSGFIHEVIRFKALEQSWKWTLVLAGSSGGFLLLLACALAAWTPLSGRMLAMIQAYRQRLARIRYAGLLIYAGLLGLYPAILFGPFGRYVSETYFQVSVLVLLAMLGAEALKLAWPGRRWLFWGVTSLFLFSAYHKLLAFLPAVSNDPFTLAYSEASSYYYASLFFSPWIYGFRAPLPIVNPAYHLLESLPFLLHRGPIWLDRLWEASLWVALPLATAIAAAFQLRMPKGLIRGLFIFWAFLFLSQGPIYYHLLVCVLIVLVGFTSRSPWVRWAAVLAASAWAGICRVNWFPMPGLLAATLYLLEERVEGSFWRYLFLPAGWFAGGMITALGTYGLYIRFSGNPAAYFVTVFSSNLMWNRIFPSLANPISVLTQIVIVSLPAWLVIWKAMKGGIARWHWLRLAGLAVIVLAFFAGGLVVSAKIGGGVDFHNLDAYLVLLFVIFTHLMWGRFVPDADPGAVPSRYPLWPLACVIVLPALVVVLQKPVHFSPPRDTQADVSQLQGVLDNLDLGGKEVLFVYQRQLLTFDQIKGVRLVPEYERVTLMEMAMGDNEAYLKRFYTDLNQHRFAAIVSDPIHVVYKGAGQIFGEENDIWLTRIALPILQDYREEVESPDGTFEVLVPKPGD